MAVELFGYKYSVYTWIARFALAEKGVASTGREIDPFAEDVPGAYQDLHPFKRVPVLVHDGFVVYETNAITRYVNDAFAGPPLMPETARACARCNQIISVIDSYGYWPLVRQAYSHGVFRPGVGEPSDTALFQEGLAAAPRILGALESLAGDREFLAGDYISLADIHLAPMISFFAEVPEGQELLAKKRRLAAWWSKISQREKFIKTKPPMVESRGH